MGDRLRHFLPSNHPERDWEDVVECIPKEHGQYAEQIAFLKRTFNAGSIKAILDVGAGDGSFTRTILNLLEERQLLAKNPIVHIVEKEDALFAKLKLVVPRAERLRVSDERFDFSEQSEGLLEDVERIAGANECRYDLIIASHVTYYFDNAGVTLIYSLASRLLCEEGLIWVITRDRSCALYQKREEILLRERLIDVNRASFSDSIVDRLNCIYELGSLGDAIQPTLIPRASTLTIPEDAEKQKRLFGYLLWLNGLSDDHIQDLARLTGNIFSETHLFAPCLSRHDFCDTENPDEHSKLLKISVVADCIDIVRRFANDIQIQRVSMAGVQPKGLPTGDEDGRSDPDRPSLLPEGFTLSAVGFGYYPTEHANDNTLTDFFIENTSFLFYPRFFHDYRHKCGESSELCDFALVERLGMSKQPEYPIRRIRGNPSVDTTKKEPKLLAESAKNWFDRLRNVYCTNSDDGKAHVWSMCVGATVSSDVFRFFTDHQLNDCCALFITFSTTHDIEAHKAEIIPHLRVRLTQWLGHNFYSKAQAQLFEANNRAVELKKQAEMLRVLQRPLIRVSEALSAMQSDTQELRAILFEPDEALFASHAEIAPFFIEGEFHGFKQAGISALPIHHTPDDYLKGDSMNLQYIFAGVLCAIFGNLDDLKRSRGKRQLIANSIDILSEAEAGASTKQMADNLKWLLIEGNSKLCVSKEPTFSDMLNAAVGADEKRKAVVIALRNVKNALFAPFKPDTNQWHSLPLRLLARNEAFKYAVLELASEVRVNDSPVSYATILAYLRDLVIALNSKTRRLTRLSLKTDGKVVLACEWSEAVAGSNRSMIDCVFVRKTVRRLIRFPREWRVESANYGDLSRPFIMLANKALGLNEAGGWVPTATSGDEVMALEKPDDTDGSRTRRFSISCAEQQLTIRWNRI